MKILLCDGDYKNALGITRALGKNGHEILVMAQRRGSLCSRSKYCRAEVIAPPYDDPDFTRVLRALIEEHEIELVIPVGTPAHRKMSQIKNRIPGHCRMVIAGAEMIAFCMNKEKTYRHAEKVGIPVPRTYYPASIEEISLIAPEMTYPCVIKGRYETGFNVIAYVDRADALRDKYAELCRKFDLTAGDRLPLIQEYISGDGYGFFAVYNNGRCGPTFQHHRLREYPPSGGMSVCAESSRHPRVFEYGKKLLDSLKWHGPAMVEFKVNRGNIPVLMEINPKFWGSLDLGLEAGVNFPQALVDIAQKGEVAYSDTYKYPFKYHWPLHGDLLHALMRPYRMPAFLLDCLNPGVKSNLWLTDDLRGTLGIIGNLLRKTVKRLFNG